MQREKDVLGLEKSRGRLFAAASAVILVTFGLCGFSFFSEPAQTKSQSHPVQVSKSQPPRMLESGAPFSFADLVERVSPAVVTVTVEQKVDPSEAMNLPDDLPAPFRQFFHQFGDQGPQEPQPRKAIAMGSGFIIDKSGLIVTNNHVIDDSTKITVKLPDGRQFVAKLIGTDPATDIALLKVKSDKPLPTVEFGDDHQMRVGDWVVAVGNPFGLSNSVTAGIISSINRDIGNGPYTDYIQIDAPINRGNSGGPTFDLQGRVIGMNTMIYSPSGGSVGIGFAIPSSVVHEVVTQLQQHGHVARGWLGVGIQSVTPEIATSLGLKEPKGAIVANIVPDGPAAKAGFQPGDVVVAVNGKSVEDSRDLTRRVASLSAGTSASFNIVRNGSPKTLTANIAPREDKKVASLQPNSPNAAPASAKAMGLALAPLTAETRHAYNVGRDVDGVVITKVDPNSDAADKGLLPGDVLMSIGNQPVHTPQDVQSRVANAHAQGRKSVLLLVGTTNGPRFVAVDIS
ncbi:MAG TPA: DegQ family serine endoprotease [Rhizomicrobium sp.]|nr:DegQ family serine endoprotease [Rhizomicrobium sp.]